MPLVFVHGVATRQTPSYQREVDQRDALFRRLVVGDDLIFDPDWGKGGVAFNAAMPWMPAPEGEDEAYTMGAGDDIFSDVVGNIAQSAHVHPEDAIDAAFVAALNNDEATAAHPVSSDLAAAFEAAVKYLERKPDGAAFEALTGVDDFSRALEAELAPFAPVPTGGTEPMGLKDAFAAIGSALRKATRKITDPVRDLASDSVLRLVRRPLSRAVALFLGDIFVYLRWREADIAAGTYARIFKPIIKDLIAANKARADGKPLILVCHSLGAVILYDLLQDARALAEIQAGSGKPLSVDHWVTVGAQPALFADMGLYAAQRDATTKRFPKPACVAYWINVYDYTDVLAFRSSAVFSDVTDYRYNNVAGLIDAHTTYFKRPSFYTRLKARLSGAVA